MKTKMTVALPTSTFLPSLGGVEIGLHNIALNLIEQGHKPVIISSYLHIKKLQQENWNLPYPVEAFPPKLFTIMKKSPKLGQFYGEIFLNKLNQKYHFDFWHVTMGYPTGILMVKFAQKYKNIKYLIRCAGEDIQIDKSVRYGCRLNPKIDKLVTNILKDSKILVAISSTMEEEYKKLGVKDSQIINIPNGADIERFQTANFTSRDKVRKDLNVGDKDILFLCVGRNHPKKNFIILVEVCIKLIQSGTKNFKILIVGKGVSNLLEGIDNSEIKSHLILKDNTSPSNLNKNLILPSETLFNYYMSADVFIFPSLIESFGIVLVEAMAAKLPIITTNAPGCRDIIREGKDGIMIDKNNSDQMVNAMIDLINDSEKRKLLAEKSLKRSQAFSWKNIVKQYISAYQI